MQKNKTKLKALLYNVIQGGDNLDLVNGYKLMEYAKRNNYVLPAFNTTNLETTSAIIQAFQESGKGGYIAISSNNLRLSSAKIIADTVKEYMKDVTIPISLHLDHGKSFEDVRACIDAGFTSIMIDMSHLDFEENIAAVKEVVDYCHFFNIPVEAELGAIGGKEDEHVSEESFKTNPEEVSEFVERTGCDSIAVAIGNVHGLDIEPNLDFELLSEIEKSTEIPIVLHGGSGIPFEQVRRAKENNLIKVNYGSDLRKEFISTFGQAYKINNNEFNLMALSEQSVVNIKNKAISIINEINKKREISTINKS